MRVQWPWAGCLMTTNRRFWGTRPPVQHLLASLAGCWGSRWREWPALHLYEPHLENGSTRAPGPGGAAVRVLPSALAWVSLRLASVSVGSICLCLWPSLCLPWHASAMCLCVSVCLSPSLPAGVSLSLCECVCLSGFLCVCVYFSVDVYFCVCACSGCPCLTLWPPVCVCASTPISPFIPSLPVSLCVSSSLRGVHTCVFSVHVACVCFHVSLPLCLSPRLRLLQAGPVRQSSGCVKADSVADRKPAALPAARQCLWRWHRLGQVCGLRMRWPQ